MLKTDYSELENEESFQTFKTSKMSRRTFDLYFHSIKDFLEYTKLGSYDKLVQLSRKDLQRYLISWIRHDVDRGLKGESVRTKMAGIERFFDVNDVIYNKKLVRLQIPKDEAIQGGDVPFTNEDIQQMLRFTTSLRTRALIHFLASTGARPASIADPILLMKHLVDMPNGCKAIKIYEGSKEGYWVFLTPEATKSLEAYLKSRKLNGEKITDDSPLFVNSYKAGRVRYQHLSVQGLSHVIHNLLFKSAIDRTKTGERFDKAAIYGFRKRFNTVLKLNNTVNSNIAEKLLAHKNGLDGTYLKPTREQCFTEFAKAITDLTIDDSERKNIRIEKLEKEKSEHEKNRIEIDDLKKKIDALRYGPEARQAELLQLVHSIEQRVKTKEYDEVLAPLGMTLHEENSQSEDKPSIIEALIRVWFELRAPEKQKQEVWKKIKNLKEGETMSMTDYGPSNGLRVKNFYDDGSGDDLIPSQSGNKLVSSLE